MRPVDLTIEKELTMKIDAAKVVNVKMSVCTTHEDYFEGIYAVNGEKVVGSRPTDTDHPITNWEYMHAHKPWWK